MADKTVVERLQPSLLDRLTDDAPTETKERRDNRVIDIRQLRDIIQRDLSWLLNTSDNAEFIDSDRFPCASNSVLNFGVREVAGTYSTEEKAELIRRSMHTAIERFEPRILPGSIEVEFRVDSASRRAVIYFDIHADMWAQPLPMELYLRSQVDVTTGEVALERVA